MELKFIVQNPNMSPNAVRATIKGVETTATVDMYEVDLVSTDTSNGGLKLRFSGGDMEKAKELFKNDTCVTATFAKDESYKHPT
jgi:hypothetical protein